MEKAKITRILATDCGSTTTKAILIEKRGDEYRLQTRGEAPTTVEPVGVYLDEASRSLARELVSAAEGELIGPVAHQGRSLLGVVTAKVPPKLTDPPIRERAERSLIERHVARLREERVTMHADL